MLIPFGVSIDCPSMRRCGDDAARLIIHVMTRDGVLWTPPSIAAACECVLTAKMLRPAFPRMKMQRHNQLTLMSATGREIRTSAAGDGSAAQAPGPPQLRALSHRERGTMTIFLPHFGRSLTLLRDIERKRESRSALLRFRFRRTEGAALFDATARGVSAVSSAATSTRASARVTTTADTAAHAAETPSSRALDRAQACRRWHRVRRRTVACRPR